MNKVINIGIPHVGELIFESFDTPGLINCMEVSETWRELAGNVLIKRSKGILYMQIFEACRSGKTKFAQRLMWSLDNDVLFQCALAWETWKNLAENVLIKRVTPSYFPASNFPGIVGAVYFLPFISQDRPTYFPIWPFISQGSVYFPRGRLFPRGAVYFPGGRLFPKSKNDK